MRHIIVLAVAVAACKAEPAPPTASSSRPRVIAPVILRAAHQHERTDSASKPLEVEISPGIYGVPDNGKYRLSSVEHDTDEPVIEGAISERQMLHEFRQYAAVFQPGIAAAAPKRDACKSAWLARGGVLEQSYRWIVALRMVGDGTVMRVTEVHTIHDHWPKVFDDEIKDCYLASLSDISFPSTLAVDMTVEYPLCVNPI